MGSSSLTSPTKSTSSTSTPGHTLLVVEDDEVTRLKLQAYFETEGYRVLLAAGAAEATQHLAQESVDIALLDINLQDGDGLSLAREIRRDSKIGIIFVSGRDDEVDRIVGLEIGADDYVTKPFSPRELLARVRGLLRRTEAGAGAGSLPENSVRQFDGWSLNTLRRTLTDRSGALTELTKAELELLDLFTRYPGTTLSRERLMHSITHRSWHPGDRTVDVLIRRLRRKLEQNPSKPVILRTVHGEGYMFCATVSESGAESSAASGVDASRASASTRDA